MKYKFSGQPDLVRIIRENADAEAIIVSSPNQHGPLLLLRITDSEVVALELAAHRAVDCCLSNAARPGWEFWEGSGQDLPEGWRAVKFIGSEARRILNALRARRELPPCTTVEPIFFPEVA